MVYSEPYQKYKMELSNQKLHLRCLTGFDASGPRAKRNEIILINYTICFEKSSGHVEDIAIAFYLMPRNVSFNVPI